MKLQLPQFLTFSGADDATSIAGMIALAQTWPVEFGILASRKCGRERYPSVEWMAHAVAGFGIERSKYHALPVQALPLSIHLCGEYSRDAIGGDLLPELEPFLRHFQRVQFNAPPLHPTSYVVARAFASARNLIPIAQCREQFPMEITVSWLLDESAGRGKAPATRRPRDALYWPEYDAKRLVGYAGGINKANIASVIEDVGANRPPNSTYWLDMETGVRDDKGAFDLNLCAEICQSVYGVPSAP